MKWKHDRRKKRVFGSFFNSSFFHFSFSKSIAFPAQCLISTFLILFLFFTLLANPLYPQRKKRRRPPPTEPVTIIAHYKEKIEDRMVATGNVEVHYKNIKLFADRIELNTETKDVYAEGHVAVHFPDEVANCQSIRFNLDSTEGELKEVFGRIQPTVFYEASAIQRKNSHVYSLHKARITSCTQVVPRWKFSCSRANFKKDDYIEMWNTVFSIKKIPLFYIPYMKYPLDREKATGFLMPQFGYSGTKGYFYSQSFYWAMKRNMDATFNVDYYSTRGLGGGIDYRYLFSGGTGGNLKLYYFKFKQDPQEKDFEAPTTAYLFRFNHNQPLPFHFSLMANVDFQSSFDFLREFDNNFKRAVVSNRSSVVYLSRSWSYFNLGARISRFETYFTEIDNSIIKNNLPSVNFSSSQIKLFHPLYFSFTSSFDRWEDGWESAYRLDQQTRSQSFNVSPTLTLPFTYISWLTLNSSFTGNLNYYFQSYDPRTWQVVNEPLLTTNYTLNMDLIGPVFSRIFFDAQGNPKLKHIFEPYFSYRYESPVDSSKRIITRRGFFRYHLITYGLTNHFLIKQNNTAKEVVTLGVSQSFYLAPEEGPMKLYRVEGEVPRFDDITGYLRFYPSGKFSVDASASFNVYHKNFPSLRVAANFGSPHDNLFCSVNWFKSTNPYIRDIERLMFFNRHQVGFWGGVKIPEISMEAVASFDFNIKERRMLYTSASLIYHYQCLDFKADLRIFYYRERPETQFRISFGLGNIGKTTDFLGGYE